MAALYADENYPLGIVEHLRELGHDVLTAHEAGNAGRGVSDEDVLSFATARGRAVITIVANISSDSTRRLAESMRGLSLAPSIPMNRGRLREFTSSSNARVAD